MYMRTTAFGMNYSLNFCSYFGIRRVFETLVEYEIDKLYEFHKDATLDRLS